MIILGVKISTLSKKEILKKISDFLNSNSRRGGATVLSVVTPNPEFLLTAAKDEEFFYILNKADLAIPDGIGLVLASLLMGKFIRRISGADLMYDICRIAEQKKKKVFLLGGTSGLAEKAGEKLQALYPNLQIVGAETGLKPDTWEIKAGKWIRGEAENKKLVERIKKASPDIIFVAFGHPRQEKWIYHNIASPRPAGEGPGVRALLMGVGGSFDFIAGRIKRAPKIMRVVGLEWLWRLMQEPRKRLPRIYNAVIKFPLAFLKWRFIRPFYYRPNVVCLLYKLYKKKENKIMVLLAERRDAPGHWQLLQGGTDGEDLITAGIRELSEEISTNKFKPVTSFKNIHKYKYRAFGEKIGRAGVEAKKIQGYKGQHQGLFIAEFTGKDKDITINYWDHRDWKWVELDKVVDTVAEVRKEATRIFVGKFKTLDIDKHL